MNPTRNLEVAGLIPGLLAQCSVHQGSGVAVSCGVGCRFGSDPALLWLWCGLTAVAPIRPLDCEPPHAVGEALKKQKKPLPPWIPNSESFPLPPTPPWQPQSYSLYVGVGFRFVTCVNLHCILFCFLFFFWLLVCFLGLHLQHMEVPRLGFESELLLAYTRATATWDPSWAYKLRHRSWKGWSLNPLSKARDWTRILMETSWVCYCWPKTGIPICVVF